MDATASRTILYIEDDPEMIELVRLILKPRGYDVVGAQGGRQGLDFIAVQVPDLILLDLMMPDVDGWEVYQQVRGNPLTHQIPVIVVTAKAQTIDKVLGLHIAGVDGYVCKPFHPQELIDSIARVLSRSAQTAPPGA